MMSKKPCNDVSTFMEGRLSDFASQMTSLVNNVNHSDIKFLLGPDHKVVYAHRCVLAARCSVFQAMFSEQSQKEGFGDKDVPLVLTDVNPDIFLLLLEFIYTNCVPLTQETAVDVLVASIEYGLEDLKKVCIRYLTHTLSPVSACKVMQTGVLYCQDELCSSALAFIEENCQSVLKSDHFLELSEDAVVSILKSNRLDMDELDILAAIKKWATINAKATGVPIEELSKNVLKYLRLHLLSTDELSVVEESNVDDFISLDALTKAWKFHALKRVDKDNPLPPLRRGTRERDCHVYLKNS